MNKIGVFRAQQSYDVVDVSTLGQPFSHAGVEQSGDGKWHGWFWYSTRPEGVLYFGPHITGKYDTPDEAYEALKRGERFS